MDNKTCTTCCYFKAYYTKAYSCFLRTDCGNCSFYDKKVKKKERCENWKYKNNFRRDKVQVVFSELGNIITKISSIQLILEEEVENK